MIGYDRFLSGKCPRCNEEMTKEPLTVISNGGPDKQHRYVYENSSCKKCGDKFSRLVKERRPSGVS